MPITVRLGLQNLASQTRTFSLEPIGDYCDLGPSEIAHATWEIQDDGSVEIEIAVTDDAVLLGHTSPATELRPDREAAGGDRWA
jgi:DNA-directed RNA polymerase beta subunit